MVLHLERPPLNESSIVVFSEKAFLAGAVLSATFYGVHLTIFLQCAYLLWTRRRNVQHSYRLLAFVIVTFALGTSSVITISIANQYTFIDYRNIPGGPVVFATEASSIPNGIVVSWSSVVEDWLTGGLLLWRGLMVYHGSPWRWIMLFPGLIYLGAIGCEIRYLVWEINPSLVTGKDSERVILLPFFVISNSLVIVTSALIAVRLLLLRKRIVSVLGREHAKQYISVTAMIIESALLVAVFSFVYLMLYAVGNPIQETILFSITQVAFIGPLLIIYRVTQGRAWSSDTVAASTTSQLDPPHRPHRGSGTFSGSGSSVPVSPAQIHLKERFSAGTSEDFIHKHGSSAAGSSKSEVMLA